MSTRFGAEPRHPDLHLFEACGAAHLFLPNGSRIFAIDAEVVNMLKAALDEGGHAVLDALAGLDLAAPAYISDNPPSSFPVRALSLAVSQKCNLGCTYCYADGGSFGETPRNMPLDVALQAIDALLGEASEGEHYTLAFLGGEPLANRAVMRAAVDRACQWSAVNGSIVRFSITTNGTLVTADDAAFFDAHRFAVTVSLDGFGELHDRQRPFKNGRGSFAHIVRRLAPLLVARHAQVTARVTVTPQNLGLQTTLDDLLDLGFTGVGFSPMLASPRGTGEMLVTDLARFLDEMITCGRVCERRLSAGQAYGFLNLLTALQEIHRGTHRPYPCGAGAGYVAASADGELYACHRFVGDENAGMGSARAGLDLLKQADWLAKRHVHRQEPCGSCWARYLCGGGCHHEVMRRGRAACDYIRGWLQYCLQAYVRLLDAQPDMFPSAMSGHCGPAPRSADTPTDAR